MKKYLAAILVAFVLVGCSQNDSSQTDTTTTKPSKNASYKVGDKILLKSVTGNEITVVRTENGFKLDGNDKMVMFDIFGTFCQPCRDEAPHLMNFQLKHSDDFMMIGLIHFEDVDNQYIIDNFSKNYNAYYFIANSKDNPNERLINQILKDISYNHAIALPFKVLYNKGAPEILTDNEMRVPEGRKYYLGSVSTRILEVDFNRIKNAN
ncbi:hypothetical protein [Campylobacter geochelonis]|uniref:Thioredoxin domain-containing protein n=1 Tax=Campylobacter geochelonis TaxID=1780362 RepID=A0A128EF52_9BACT|nr:hypothetical protein [Campylobacter geochelonis]QKF70964.1 protein disulfide reductase, TlpA family [Campylobacter geochelonis]CZE47051.1 thioredoxin domain-containing protein [Campylobacter geochelonis]CZE47540.1 thioredoxin domain-containing protein [Campylobacter geochelonis]CZE50220.1 thioredoxin domain-containing protein [Campylobacter geochelonis]